jgi:hypothetical protein
VDLSSDRLLIIIILQAYLESSRKIWVFILGKYEQDFLMLKGLKDFKMTILSACIHIYPIHWQFFFVTNVGLTFIYKIKLSILPACKL